MPRQKGKFHWMHRRKSAVNEFYKSSGAISAMIADLSPEDLRSVVGWGKHILRTRPGWYRKKWAGGE